MVTVPFNLVRSHLLPRMGGFYANMLVLFATNTDVPAPLSNHDDNRRDTDLSFLGRVCRRDHRNVLLLQNSSSPALILVDDCTAHL